VITFHIRRNVRGWQVFGLTRAARWTTGRGVRRGEAWRPTRRSTTLLLFAAHEAEGARGEDPVLDRMRAPSAREIVERCANAARMQPQGHEVCRSSARRDLQRAVCFTLLRPLSHYRVGAATLQLAKASPSTSSLRIGSQPTDPSN